MPTFDALTHAYGDAADLEPLLIAASSDDLTACMDAVRAVATAEAGVVKEKAFNIKKTWPTCDID